jgi:phosphate transport system substrate-binding protein
MKAIGRAALAVLALIAALMAIPPATSASVGVTLQETGSSLIFPLFRVWLPAFAKEHPGVRIVTNSTGSAVGVTQAMAGRVQIGTSDAFMTDAQLRGNPNIMNIPLAISAQTINYNLPGLNRAGLHLDGPVLAGIYSGSIRYWDAPEIAQLNPSLKLPHRNIVPVHRSDGSGDTFIFTQFLSFSTPSWDNAAGAGTTITWPSVPGSTTAVGNPGMLETLDTTPYAIAYIGVSFQSTIAKDGLGTAWLKNEDGNFVLPTQQTVLAAAASLGPRTPADERLSLVFAPGRDSYPLVNYEYAIVSRQQPNAATAQAIREFLFWSIEPCDGNATNLLDAVHFIPLPEYVRALSYAQIATIK